MRPVGGEPAEAGATPGVIDLRTPDAATIDLTILEDLERMAGSAGFDHLIALFLDESRTRIQLLGEAAAGSSIDDAILLCHRIKGASGGFGAARLSELAASLHRQLRSGDVDTLPAKVRQIEAEFAVVERLLRSRAGGPSTRSVR
jgi:HPt (histidine-containing phosphotransfer) domain-containing protein